MTLRIATLFLLTTLSALAQPSALGPVDILDLALTRGGRISPDGEFLIFQKSEVSWARNRWVSQLWRQTLATGELRQMTFDQAGARNPLWSPDGRRLAFLSERGEDDHSQIYLMHADGGEAYRVAELPTVPANLSWSPDSKWIYYTARKARSKQERDSLRKKTVIPRFEDPARAVHLFRLRMADGEVEKVAPAKGSIFDYSLSDDGETILFIKGAGLLIDQAHQAEIYQAKADGSDATRITHNAVAERSCTLSPDNRRIAYLATVNEVGEEYYDTNLFVINRASGEQSLLAGEWQAGVSDYAWDADGSGLFVVANIGVSDHLFHLDLASGERRQLTSGDWTIREWSYDPATGRHLINRMSATEPGDYWVLGQGNGGLARITDLQREFLAQFRLPRQERVEWQSPDGVTIEGLYTYPLDYVEGEAYPLVVDIHGGPQMSDQFGLWSSGRFLTALSARGYGILLPNHRGSTGYGDDFLRDMVGRYFRNSHLDVLSGVDHLIAGGLADPERLVVKGWSAGGHMTNKLITYTDRFKAAASGAGTVEWMSQYGETDTNHRRTIWFGGKPWEENAPLASYRETSVLDDLWKVTTPTLIFVGEKDVRVPASQSKMLFRGLRDLGVETELYVAPGEPHGYRKPSHRLFRINKELEWFEKHVNGLDYEYVAPPKEEK